MVNSVVISCHFHGEFHQDPKPSKKKLPEGKLNIIRRFESPKIRDTANAELNKMMTKLSSVTFFKRGFCWMILGKNKHPKNPLTWVFLGRYCTNRYIQKRRVSSLKNINMLAMKSGRSWDGTESSWFYMNGFCKKGKVQEPDSSNSIQKPWVSNMLLWPMVPKKFKGRCHTHTHTNLEQSKQHHCWADCSWNARNLPVYNFM